MSMYDAESDLVHSFGEGLASHGLRLPSGRTLQAVVIGHEVGLAGASSRGNTGAADLLVVTEDHRFWLIESKLAASREAIPAFLFGNQLARYAASMEQLGIERLHPRLQAFLYGRRSVLTPPAALAPLFERCRTLTEVLEAWCTQRGHGEPQAEAEAIVRSLHQQLQRRTLTLAALLDAPGDSHREWIAEAAPDRSQALLTHDDGRPVVVCETLKSIEKESSDPGAFALAPFDQIPQSFKPTPSTLPRLLSTEAFALYADVLSPRLTDWTRGEWPKVKLSTVTDAAFSLDLESPMGRSICLQIGRAAFAGGGGAGEHPLKLIVNCIWAAEGVYERSVRNPRGSAIEYAELESLLLQLCSHADMKVRGISKAIPIASDAWRQALQPKLRGDLHRRPEVVAVRERGEREGYGWSAAEQEVDRRLLTIALDLIESWLGPSPYKVVPRRKSARKVPGMVRS